VEDSKNKDNEAQTLNSFLDKDLEVALDSFDNLFCRRCLVSIILVLLSVLCFYRDYIASSLCFMLTGI
jgi:hypothetical protein